jgi:hypothetical protein
MMKTFYQSARKAVVAALLGALGALGTGALADGKLSKEELLAAALVGAAAGFATFQVSNAPTSTDEGDAA